jgi:exodeoxyribonuclease V
VQTKPELTAEQQAVAIEIFAFVERGHPDTFSVAGLAGTGKSTLLAYVAGFYPNAILCAPTGKATSVLRAKTARDAQTLHQVLYIPNPWVDDEGIHHLGWIHRCSPGQLRGILVLLDESSMAPLGIVQDLLTAGARIVAFGDPGQLGPVMGKPAFPEADATLKQIHRQAAGNPIIRQAHRVRSGGTYCTDGDEFQVWDKLRLGDLEWAAEGGTILCFTNKTRHLMNAKMREMRGIDPTEWPRRGEPLLCLHNDHDRGMMNGEIFIVAEDYAGVGKLRFEGDFVVENPWLEEFCLPLLQKRAGMFSFGYALTVHKSQGSEWDRVVLLDENNSSDSRRWKYTGVTRAAKNIRVARGRRS